MTGTVLSTQTLKCIHMNFILCLAYLNNDAQQPIQFDLLHIQFDFKRTKLYTHVFISLLHISNSHLFCSILSIKGFLLW